ncbi:MAG: efflux RND transporter periplasmic adaptor subunit [Opitutaceae bacterium]|nr:efflux RND transporter periplasmic adaptor subunit [Opitutaceae bacterium]
MPRKILTFIIGFVLFLLAIAGPLFLVKTRQFAAMGAAGEAMAANMPPTVVTAAPAKPDSWSNSLGAPGSLDAVQGVTVAAEMPGKIVKLAFEAGAAVKAGDVLVQLDISTEEAQLRAAEANAALAKANLARAKDLRQSNTNSLSELDASEAQAKQAEAQAEAIRAVIAKKTIRAPFSGRLGLRMVNLGQILREGDPIATLQTLDPIYVNFSLPQQRLALLAVGTAVQVSSDAAPGDKFPGKINAISPEIDATTRNIRVQATIANRDEKLRPGMYASVEVLLPTDTKVLMIPVTAVLYAPYGDSVFVIDEKKDEKSGKVQQVLRQQFVRLGAARGDFVNVTDGLKAGENVVSSGVFKLRPGMAVAIDNKLAPDAKLAPKPKNS